MKFKPGDIVEYYTGYYDWIGTRFKFVQYIGDGRMVELKALNMNYPDNKLEPGEICRFATHKFKLITIKKNHLPEWL